MIYEIICENCGKVIPEGMKHVEHSDGKCFCNEICDGEYDDILQGRYDGWINDLDVGDKFIYSERHQYTGDE